MGVPGRTGSQKRTSLPQAVYKSSFVSFNLHTHPCQLHLPEHSSDPIKKFISGSPLATEFKLSEFTLQFKADLSSSSLAQAVSDPSAGDTVRVKLGAWALETTESSRPLTPGKRISINLATPQFYPKMEILPNTVLENTVPGDGTL